MIFEDVMTKIILPAVGILLTGGPGVWAMSKVIARDRAEALAVIAKAQKEKAETDRVYWDMAREAGAEVITKNNELEKLRNDITEMRQDMAEFKLSYAKLEIEKSQQDLEISKLRERVLKLETTLIENDIPIPNNNV